MRTLDSFIPPLLGGANITSSVPSNFTLPVPEIPGLPAGVKIGGTEFRFDTLSFASLFIRMVISFCAVTLFGLNGLPCLMRFVRSHLKVREIYFCIFIGIILLVSYLRRRVAYTAP